MKRVIAPGGIAVTLRNQLRTRIDPTSSLDGITPTQWWQIINSRIYFFCRRTDAEKLCATYLGHGYVQEVIEFKTHDLFAGVANQVEVTTVNAGVFPRVKGPTRGKATFIPLSKLDLPSASKIREITVGIPFTPPVSAVVTAIRRDALSGPSVMFA